MTPTENARRAWDPFAPHFIQGEIEPPALKSPRDPADLELVRALLNGKPAPKAKAPAKTTAVKKPAAKRTAKPKGTARVSK